jgi:hypothetical protein
MRRSLVIEFVFAAVLAAIPAQAGIERFWLSPGELGDGWESIAEATRPVSDDPDLQRWGVRARETRHYTRYRDRHIEVCSVEIWSFASEAQASAAHEGFSYPNWVIEREGARLLMLHGRSWTRGKTPRREMFAACREIGRRVRMRVARDLAQ